MGSSGCSSEIVEFTEEFDDNAPVSCSNLLHIKVKAEEKNGRCRDYPVEDDLEQLLKAIDSRTFRRTLSPGQVGADALRKNGQKKSTRSGPSQTAGIGISSKPVNMKQALRRLCISQASEMAAMKRLSMSPGSSSSSEAGTIHRLYASLMVQSNDESHLHDDEKMNLIEISITPKFSKNSSRGTSEFSEDCDFETADGSAVTSLHSASSTSAEIRKIRIQDVISGDPIDSESSTVENGKLDKKVSAATDDSSPRAPILSKPITTSRLVKPVVICTFFVKDNLGEAFRNQLQGTHEYLAPEIIKGDGHGSAVDWWTFGVFLYELLYGKTPFRGPGNDETLANVVSQNLKFPENPSVSSNAKDLIKGLLVKEPENRLGSLRGAAEIKQHPFFEGLNWALIRSAAPPETRPCDVVTLATSKKKKEGKCLEFRSNSEDLEFEVF
ncbi:hypothetical protein E2562_010117 [Oryza meyeriana var. granulata]|uniref:non-specific serine/threonine protein kinase n=1 Tax=Oryza meyeriana var. granulata TaxID=110450 RepID=A0A6G1EI36_9ORYZ|nr:hypothetical protein E2562_010117 [Oryza meyeriana var. granulata]